MVKLIFLWVNGVLCIYFFKPYQQNLILEFSKGITIKTCVFRYDPFLFLHIVFHSSLRSSHTFMCDSMQSAQTLPCFQLFSIKFFHVNISQLDEPFHVFPMFKTGKITVYVSRLLSGLNSANIGKIIQRNKRNMVKSEFYVTY